jgi:hypothetical protein
MAAAFRQALRKPEFPTQDAASPDSKASPESSLNERRQSSNILGQADELLDKELASEGKSVRSVGDRRRPEVHDGDD